MGNSVPSKGEQVRGGGTSASLPEALRDGSAAASPATVVRWFLRGKYTCAREAVDALLQAAVHVYGGEAHFYSAPQGRGRRAKICRGELKAPKENPTPQ